MSSAVALLPAAAPDERGDGQLPDGWLGWLRERLDPQWRASEWDPARLLFTGDPASPATVVAVCPLPGCGVTINDPHWSGYCKTCHDEFTTSGPCRGHRARHGAGRGPGRDRRAPGGTAADDQAAEHPALTTTGQDCPPAR